MSYSDGEGRDERREQAVQLVGVERAKTLHTEFATDKDADVHAITIHGDEEMKRGDYASAFQRYKKAAKLGDSKAQVKLAGLYKLAENDHLSAIEWYKIAVENGSAEAATSLGDMYMYGDGVQKDLSEAFKWFHKACNMGSPIAMFKLGQAYELGKAVPKDYEKAQLCYEKAAEQDYGRAKERLEKLQKLKEKKKESCVLS